MHTYTCAYHICLYHSYQLLIPNLSLYEFLVYLHSLIWAHQPLQRSSLPMKARGWGGQLHVSWHAPSRLCHHRVSSSCRRWNQRWSVIYMVFNWRNQQLILNPNSENAYGIRNYGTKLIKFIRWIEQLYNTQTRKLEKIFWKCSELWIYW